MGSGRGVAFMLEYLRDWYRLPSRRRAQPARPTILNLPITDNCNSRCVMCDVWKTRSVGELTPEDLSRILGDDLFRDVRHVGVSGGEPSLRRDLAECVASIVESLPRLRTLSLTTHGFHHARWASMLPAIKAACDQRRMDLTLNLSLDGVGEMHDAVRGIPGSYARVLATLRVAREAGVRVVLQATLSRLNVYGAARLLATAADELGAGLQVRVATEIARLDNRESIRQVELTARQRSFVADFLESDALSAATPSPARRLLYRDLAVRLAEGGRRRAPCFYQNEGVLLTAHGDLYHCSISRNVVGNALRASAAEQYFSDAARAIRHSLLRDVCPGCMHDQSGAWSPLALAGEIASASRPGRQWGRLARAAAALGRTAPAVLAARVAGMRPRAVARGSGGDATILCMGMYGGEHVGDAAILGGVLNRIALRYGASKAFVLSIRPHRTRRWVSGLALPLAVEVLPYSEASRAMALSDRLVLAGGPVMEIPSVLLREIDLARAASRQHKPFHIEGVGIGPLRSPLGRFLASTLLGLAQSIDVRSARSARDPSLRGVVPSVSPDPAWEYVSQRRILDRIDPDDASRLDRLLAGPRDLTVALNLRPLWQRYGISGDVRGIEAAFLESFAGAMLAFRGTWAGSVRFVFLPMNADQYGFSDLDAAYRLARRLPAGFPFSVFETEPDVDAALALLRRADVAVMMRLHACVFALSQEVPTLGLDYSFGRPGKVSELFADSGIKERVCRIDQFQPAWLADHLTVLAQGAGVRGGRLR